MKHLLLMRHGKSEMNKPGQEDIERPLAPRGQKAAVNIAKWAVANHLTPDIALVSAARRTQETWRFAQSALGKNMSADILDALYLASPGVILEQIAGISHDVETAWVVGHNPGLESLSHMLAGPGSDAGALDDLRRGFPTAGLAVFELAGSNWAALSADGARLVSFLRPRDLD